MTASTLDKQARVAILERHVKPGVLLTHTRCMGCIEEHVFTGYDGAWLCGTPTRETRQYGGSKLPVNDIAPGNVTHVNRVPVEALDFLHEATADAAGGPEEQSR